MLPSTNFALSCDGATRSACEQAVEVLRGVAALRPRRVARRLDRLRRLGAGPGGAISGVCACDGTASVTARAMNAKVRGARNWWLMSGV